LRLPRSHDCDIQCKAERAALAGAAFDFDVASHQLHDVTADHQPQARSAETVLRVADLGERLEDGCAILRGDTDAGVANLEAQARRLLADDAQTDAPPIGE